MGHQENRCRLGIGPLPGVEGRVTRHRLPLQLLVDQGIGLGQEGIHPIELVGIGQRTVLVSDGRDSDGLSQPIQEPFTGGSGGPIRAQPLGIGLRGTPPPSTESSGGRRPHACACDPADLGGLLGHGLPCAFSPRCYDSAEAAGLHPQMAASGRVPVCPQGDGITQRSPNLPLCNCSIVRRPR